MAEYFLYLGTQLCSTILLSNKPALSNAVQINELLIPTAKHPQTNLHVSFKAVYVFSLALSKFPVLT